MSGEECLASSAEVGITSVLAFLIADGFIDRKESMQPEKGFCASSSRRAKVIAYL